MTKSPSFQLSADARFLYQHLKTIRVGSVVSYADLSAVIGRDVAGDSTALQRAIRICLREDNIVFANIRGEGYKRLNDAEIVDTGADTIARIRRTSKRGVQKMLAVQKFDDLPNDKKLQHSARVSVLASLVDATTSKQMKKVEGAIGEAAKQLPVAETLRLFSS